MATINRGEVRRLTGLGGPLARDLTARQLRVQNRSRILCPVAMGRLRASIIAGPVQSHPFGLAGQVGSNLNYAAAVHDGSDSPAAPRSWKIAAARGRPVPPRRYLTNALPAARN